MKKYVCCLLLLALMACSKDDASDTPVQQPARRTVVVYMSAENNLSSYGFLENDLAEMKTGRRQVGDDEALVVYVDKQSATERPFLARVTTEGRLDTLYRYPSDFYSSDPARMADVLDRALRLCPATEDYGLVLWGHANGWLIEKDSVANNGNRAYGYDTGRDHLATEKACYLNIPSLREVLASLPVRWKFILFDCCNMLTAEVAYELRSQADYLIGSPAEIPGIGAPYYTVVKDMFTHDDAAMYTSLCDHYFAQPGSGSNERTPLAVVKTGEMVQLAEATRQVLPQVSQFLASDDKATEGAVYYYGDPKYEDDKALYDMQDIIRTALKGDDARYKMWHDAFSRAVVYSRQSSYWQTGHSDVYYGPFVRFTDFTEVKNGVRVFRHGADCCGVMSMFFPMERYSHTARHYNDDLKRLGWYYAVGWQELGW